MIFTIFKKELKDTLRDRRTLMMMLVIPILIFPIIMNLFASVSKSFQEEAANKKIKIGIVGTENNFLQLELNAIPKELGEKEIILYKDTLSLINDLKKDSLQLGAYVSSEFNQLMDSMHPAPLTFFFNATDMGMQERAEAYMAVIDAKAKSKRFVKLGIEEARTQPITTEYRNIASDKEMIGKLAGGILPYIFIAFGFIGCMYPAIDLFTGEKERGTIETLLTTPVARWQILFGKMGVVVLSGLTAATCALLGLFFSIEFIDSEGNAEILKIVHSILNPTFIVLLYSLLIPLTVFFAGLMIPIAVNAKSFKEAQSIITPLNIVMVLPAMVGFFPGIELNFVTACIPVVNIVLATKELIAGSLDIGLVALSFSVMMSLAVLSVIFSYKRFDNETNIII
ncbi:MAG: ABC transporter permease subunit [Crocinitomicaceae bacterium]|nr:ABC transporter permease subunit [Crocinitomicaceae bacterium]MDP4866775.1 ABC transporter permease subunit [Crocinitomicaceae bacterium]MDP5011579.1 ABC transporter permease subunit [Crocinitomicaceae bacterium]